MFDDHARSKMVTVHVGRFSKVFIGELTWLYAVVDKLTAKGNT